MEGLMAVFTLPLEKRLIALCSSIINSYYPLKITEWNPVPLQLTTFEMADIVSSNRSTISTVINQWIEEGLAKRDGEGEENFVGDSEIIALGGASNETKDRPLG